MTPSTPSARYDISIPERAHTHLNRTLTLIGQVRYQNELTHENEGYFHACDGIFLNYWWRQEGLRRSAERAGTRRHDVYAGIDVFARGAVVHGPGLQCVAGSEAVGSEGVSVAFFAPGWVHECGNGRGQPAGAAWEADRCFWECVTAPCCKAVPKSQL